MSFMQKIMLTMAGLLLIVFFVIIVIGKNGLIDLNILTVKYENMVKVNNRLKNENNDLFRRVARLQNDDKLIETIARDELGMIGTDEIIYQIRLKEEQ